MGFAVLSFVETSNLKKGTKFWGLLNPEILPLKH